MPLILTLALIDLLATMTPTATKPDNAAWVIGAPGAQVCIIAMSGYTPNEIQDEATWCIAQMF